MNIKIAEDKPVVAEKPTHYFGSTCFNWALGESPEEVLANLAKAAGANSIKVQVKHNGGLYAWICKVHAPRSSPYVINFFQPQGVEVSECQEFNIMNSKGHCLPITKEKKDG
ncbi:hypothetical protein [Pseudomonas laurylsulfatiphila]|uniref:hypothetical protein n=1 Tax=Pseudomonas laurylsulfatiphila TaxID=2011015 RepID=UPI003D1A6F36